MTTVPKDGVAFVTGAASGIGAACAQRLAPTHEVVVLADIAPIPRTLVERAEHSGAQVVAVRCDVAQEADVVSALTEATRFGPLRSAVNAAGIGGPSQPAGDYPLAAWNRVLEVNLTGTFLCIREEVRAMLAANGGSIVTISSVLGTGASATAPAYTAAKHALEGLSQSTALAYARAGIRVNTVAPGFIDTDLLRARRSEAERAALADRHPLGRLGDVDEVAAAAAFLCSSEAGFITGSTYRVDGGFLIQS